MDPFPDPFIHFESNETRLIISRPLFSGPKTVQASVTLLEHIPIFLEKTDKEELEQDILPMLFMAMESLMSQVQMAAVSVVPDILDYLCEETIRVEVLPRMRRVYSIQDKEGRVVLSLLACVAKVGSVYNISELVHTRSN